MEVLLELKIKRLMIRISQPSLFLQFKKTFHFTSVYSSTAEG